MFSIKKYYLYILKCSDNSLYTGITTDIVRRVREHNSKKLGSKYTRARRPVELVLQKEFENRSAATHAEIELKNLSRKEKLNHILNFNKN